MQKLLDAFEPYAVELVVIVMTGLVAWARYWVQATFADAAVETVEMRAQKLHTMGQGKTPGPTKKQQATEHMREEMPRLARPLSKRGTARVVERAVYRMNRDKV